MRRRTFLLGGTSAVATFAVAQTPHGGHGDHYESLQKPGRIGLPDLAHTQRFYDSPAPKAPNPGRWMARAPLPLPRGANHVGVAVMDARLFAVGGHLDQNRKPDDQCFALELAKGRWSKIAPLPNRCGAVALVAYRGRIHAVGGAIGDTSAAKKSVDWHLAYAPDADRWEKRAPMPTGRDHTGTLVVGPYVHVIGGRVDNFHTNSNLLL
jgi:hypothetical protein